MYLSNLYIVCLTDIRMVYYLAISVYEGCAALIMYSNYLFSAIQVSLSVVVVCGVSPSNFPYFLLIATEGVRHDHI